MNEANMRPFRVLIVEDQREARRVLRASLETLNCEMQIVDVPSGEEAILVNSRQPFDLLIADVRLPGISGLELIEHGQFRNPDLKVILVTGMTDEAVREKVARAHADAYFYKPVEMDDFLSAVQRCLKLEPTSERRERERESPPRGSAHRISERLARLRIQMGAHCAVLLNERGEAVAQAGAFPQDMEADALTRSVVAGLNAVEKTSLIIGSVPLNDLTVISGGAYDLALNHVGRAIGLLLIAPPDFFRTTKMTDLAKEMRAASTDIQAILTQIGVLPPLVEEKTPQPALEQAEAPESEEPIPELDEIFSPVKRVKSSDADAFWETAAEDEPADESLRADTISYDQARQLGLAPDEG
jgi:CheY-like chemotaxis protein